MTKKLLAKTIPDKIMEQKREIKQKLDGARKVWDVLLRLFWLVFQSLISGREAEHYDLSPPKFESFLMFPNFLKSFYNLWANSYIKSVILYTKFRFTCSESDLLKHYQVPKYYDQNDLEIFGFFSRLPMLIKFSWLNQVPSENYQWTKLKAL